MTPKKEPTGSLEVPTSDRYKTDNLDTVTE